MTVRFHDDRIERELFLNPELALAEGYMDGRIDFEEGSIHDLLTLFWLQRKELRKHPIQKLIRSVRFRIRRFRMHNPLGVAGRRVKHHYDIPTDFYRLWLDETMTYSCAYWYSPEVGLENAQRAKLRHSRNGAPGGRLAIGRKPLPTTTRAKRSGCSPTSRSPMSEPQSWQNKVRPSSLS